MKEKTMDFAFFWRVRWAFAVFFLCVPAVGGCCQHTPADVMPPMVVIDMHTHVFNAHDLPLRGIFLAHGVPEPVASAGAEIVNWWTRDDDFTGPRVVRMDEDQVPLSDNAVDIAARIRKQVVSRRGLGRESLFAPLSQTQKDALVQYAQVRGEMETFSEESDEACVTVVARVLQRAQIPPPCNSLDVRRVTASSSDGIRGALRFLGVTTSSHRLLARDMMDHRYPRVVLFVHHMMDLEATYADKPQIRFGDQSRNMRKLDSEFDGKLLHFVAFDPFRRTDALTFVINGLNDGAIGVKFYPPSGYRPIQNEKVEMPADEAGIKQWMSRYGDSPDLDGINEKLFTYCESKDIPIFTHCTPGGFEAGLKYGLMADPKYWALVLKKHPRLRLCFAHAGGDDGYWFDSSGPAQSNEAESFSKQVVELCLNYENVYCETGYFEKINEDASIGDLRGRLKKVMERPSHDNTWQFGDKIMYGTDWYMIAREKIPEDYLRRFSVVFSDLELEKWRSAFFAGNASRFLKLKELGKADGGSPFSQKQRDYWRQLATKLDKQL